MCRMADVAHSAASYHRPYLEARGGRAHVAGDDQREGNAARPDIDTFYDPAGKLEDVSTPQGEFPAADAERLDLGLI